MGIFAIQVLAIWSLVALAAGLGLGAMIQKADRVEKDGMLSALLANEARRQSSH